MGRIYYVTYTGTLTNAGGNSDLLEITPADDKPVLLRSVILGQTSELGDAAEEGLEITIKRLGATFTSGSGGSTVTPVPRDSADAAAGCTCECNNTTIATTGGTTSTLAELAWNIRNSPYEWTCPDPAWAPKVKQGEGLVVCCESTPADNITVCLTFVIEEE